jgi:hypothetical protein
MSNDKSAAPSQKCGAHTELFTGPGVRVTRCGCGTVHLTLLAQGVTVRMTSEQFRNVSSGLRAAAERLDTSATQSTCVN